MESSGAQPVTTGRGVTECCADGLWALLASSPAGCGAAAAPGRHPADTRAAATIRATVPDPTLPSPAPSAARDRALPPSAARRRWLEALTAAGALGAAAPARAIDAALREIHQRLDPGQPGHARDVVLTLDACGGGFDAPVIDLLVRLNVPATVFATRRWLNRHPLALEQLRRHPGLFEIENHGADHVPAVLGRRVYGMHGPADAQGIAREIDQGAEAVNRAGGRAPRWFRGAGALYDSHGLETIASRGYQVAGFSINGDDGATAPAATVARRLEKAAPGDIVILHMNKPGSGTAEGLARALPVLLQRGLRFVKLSDAGDVVLLPDTPRRAAAAR